MTTDLQDLKGEVEGHYKVNRAEIEKALEDMEVSDYEIVDAKGLKELYVFAEYVRGSLTIEIEGKGSEVVHILRVAHNMKVTK